jgi:hypothetical protein
MLRKLLLLVLVSAMFASCAMHYSEKGQHRRMHDRHYKDVGHGPR